MTDLEWEKFFELLDKIVMLPMPYREKAEFVKNKATEQGSDGNLEEFAGWFQSDE